MQKKKIIIIIILIVLILFLLVIFNIHLKNKKNNKKLVQNMMTDISNNNMEINEDFENQENLNINNEITNSLENKNEENTNNENIEGEEDSMRLNIKIGDKNFTATLEDNETTRSLLKKLPLTINMSELHGNEKYYYFDENLPTNSQNIRNINTGDLMIYGSNCLVIFYESFSTSYSYTKIGHIDNPEGLEQTLGSGNITVTFEVAN